MIIEFSDHVYDDETSFQWLDRIVNLFEDGWHEWYISDLASLLKSKWRHNSGYRKERMMDLAARSLAKSTRLGKKKRLLIGNTSQCQKSPQKAYEYLSKPFYLIVENAESDGAFVKAVFSKVDKPLEKLLKSRAISIENAGGKGEIIKNIERLLGEESRIMTMFDGDGLTPGTIDKKSEKIIEYCREKNVDYHVTIKREVENYIPLKTLEGWSNKNKLHGVFVKFRALSPDQRSHFDMKNGFKKRKIPVEQNILYGNLNLSDWPERTGFGNNVYKAFEEDGLSRRLLQESANDELSDFLKKIQNRT